MQDVESELGMTRDKLIQLALLLGSDYTEGVAGIGIVNAVEIVNAFPTEELLVNFRYRADAVCHHYYLRHVLFDSEEEEQDASGEASSSVVCNKSCRASWSATRRVYEAFRAHICCIFFIFTFVVIGASRGPTDCHCQGKSL